jgi:hypothetical protein
VKLKVSVSHNERMELSDNQIDRVREKRAAQVARLAALLAEDKVKEEEKIRAEDIAAEPIIGGLIDKFADILSKSIESSRKPEIYVLMRLGMFDLYIRHWKKLEATMEAAGYELKKESMIPVGCHYIDGGELRMVPAMVEFCIKAKCGGNHGAIEAYCYSIKLGV